MATLLPAATREVRLVTVPEGLPGPEHFAVIERPLTAPGPGQVLVRGQYFLVFPGLRTLIGAAPWAAPRGIYRTEYGGTTLRETCRRSTPAKCSSAPPSARSSPRARTAH